MYIWNVQRNAIKQICKTYKTVKQFQISKLCCWSESYGLKQYELIIQVLYYKIHRKAHSDIIFIYIYIYIYIIYIFTFTEICIIYIKHINISKMIKQLGFAWKYFRKKKSRERVKWNKMCKMLTFVESVRLGVYFTILFTFCIFENFSLKKVFESKLKVINNYYIKLIYIIWQFLLPS